MRNPAKPEYTVVRGNPHGDGVVYSDQLRTGNPDDVLPVDQRALAARLLGQAEPVADPTIEVALDADTRRKLDDLAE